jgi:hypothetical protein
MRPSAMMKPISTRSSSAAVFPATPSPPPS